MAESKTSPRRLLAAKRRCKALELRKLGFSHQKIGQYLGISRQAAYKAVQGELLAMESEAAESRAEIRRFEPERLDEWMIRVEKAGE